MGQRVLRPGGLCTAVTQTCIGASGCPVLFCPRRTWQEAWHPSSWAQGRMESPGLNPGLSTARAQLCNLEKIYSQVSASYKIGVLISA